MPRTKRRLRRTSPTTLSPAPVDAPTDQPLPKAAKTCTICRVEKPISEFRRRAKGAELRHCYCNPCRTAYEADRRLAQRHRQLAQFNAQLAKHRLDSRAVVALCHKLFARFRGLDNVVRLWSQHLELAMRQTPGRKYVVDAFSALLALTKVAEQFHKQQRPDLDVMSDEELEAHIRGLLVGNEGEGSEGEGR